MDSNLPNIDITSDLKESIKSVKIRMRTIEYALGFNEFKINAEKFLQKNNFTQMEIRSIFHLINSFYFMGADLEKFQCKECLNNYSEEDCKLRCNHDNDTHQDQEASQSP